MDERTTSRRRFLERSAATLVGGGLFAGAAGWRGRLLASDQSSVTAAQLIVGKDAQLIVHSAGPIEIETPLRLLAEHAVTPKSLLFVRNNQQLAGFDNLQPAATPDWNIEIVGLADRPASISVAELLPMEQVEHELVLQCSGNGRAFFSKLSPAKGAQWQCGAMGKRALRRRVAGESPRAAEAGNRSHGALSHGGRARRAVETRRARFRAFHSARRCVVAIDHCPVDEWRTDPRSAWRSGAAGDARLLRDDERQMAGAAATRIAGNHELPPGRALSHAERVDPTG